MSASLSTLQLYCSIILSNAVSPWSLDPKCIPLPWRSQQITPPSRPLRIGIISDNDGEISVHPPILRGLALTKAALRAAGHDVFEWAPTSHPRIVELMNDAFHTLGGAAIIGLTSAHEEPVFGSMRDYETQFLKGEEGALGPTALRAMIVERNAFQKAYMDRWNATAVDGRPVMDGIIMATSPWTAPRLGITQTDLFCVNFTGVWNVLGESLSYFHFSLLFLQSPLFPPFSHPP